MSQKTNEKGKGRPKSTSRKRLLNIAKGEPKERLYQNIPITEGYQPTDKLDTSNPPTDKLETADNNEKDE